MSRLIFSTKNELKRTFVITDLEQDLSRLIFDLESLGCDVSRIRVQDNTALQDALYSIDQADLLVLFCSGRYEDENYQRCLETVKNLFPGTSIILVSQSFSIRHRLIASRLGITTHLLFPYDRFQLQRALQAVDEQEEKQIYKLLLVDNHPQTAEHLLGFMRDEGFELDVLTDPYLLYENLQRYDCDLLFLRLQGEQFCCQYMNVIKEIEAIKGVSIIVLSDKASCENEEDCLSTHADACLSLPYDPQAMVRQARIYAQRSQMAKRNIRRFNAHYYERERERNVLDFHALVSATDRYGRITYVNDNFCQTSGYSSHELLGNNHRLIKSGLHDEAFYQDMWRTISSGGVWKGEICNKRKDGSLYWVDSTIAAFLNEQGEVYQYFSIRKDISNRILAEKQLHQTIDILERTNEAARIGFWEYSLKDNQLLWSKVTRLIHGVPEDYQPTVEEAINFYRPGNNQERIKSLFNQVMTKHIPYDTELVITNASGEEVWVRTIGIPDMTEGVCTRVYGLFQDITDKKHMLLSLVHAKEAAETANIAKSQFLSQMSHELRTPLNAILGFSQILQESTNLNEDEQNDVSEIYKAGTHLLTLINEVLDLSAVESGQLNFSFEPVSIQEVVEDCCQLLAPLTLKRQISMECEIDGAQLVKVDRGRLKQILLNLLSNALKYNRDQGRVRVTAEPIDGDMIRICVEDTGIGLSEAQLAQLFKPFNRLGKEKEGVEGTGIGLALSKSLTELMGGKISAESQPGKGSRFWLDFPKAYMQGEIRQLQSEIGQDLRGSVSASESASKTILYVEDNPANLKLVAHILSSRETINLLSALSPQAAIEMAFGQPVDLVLMDLNLPEMSGFDLMALLKREPQFKEVPFVAISADATKAVRQKAIDTGFVEYLSKPIDIKRFNRLIDGLLT